MPDSIPNRPALYATIMVHRTSRKLLSALTAVAFVLAGFVARADDSPDWQSQHDQLVRRLRSVGSVAAQWAPAYQPLYRAALPWYERFGGNPRHDVDNWMSPPEKYAGELVDALEHGRNFFAENPGALIPLVFAATLPDGRSVESNYWLTLPRDFEQSGRRFPLIISLHGSGWLGHKLSFVGRPHHELSGGRAFTVTPINESGPWQIDFLNAYLDELLRVFPIDADHVYVEGHSLGAMATWEWALNNPERFAAISPRAGRGEPFRASRLQHVPSWVIHGADDDIVFTGFSDQMVSALQARGAPVQYWVLPNVAHNLPDDFDEDRIVDWYRQQTRSHEPVPPDPRDALGVADAGYSPWKTITTDAGSYWKSDPVPMPDRAASLRAVRELFREPRAQGAQVDSPIIEKLDTKTNLVSFWLAVPRTLRSGPSTVPHTVSLPATRCVRFYFRGETPKALEHLAQVVTEVRAQGHKPAEEVWITPLSLWPETPSYLAEYRIELQ